MSSFRYMPSFAELIDRLNVVSSKSVYAENGAETFKQEIEDILHDINIHISQGVKVDADMIRAIVLLTQSNLAIWLNEDFIRSGSRQMSSSEKAEALTLTHSLNGTRSACKTRIQNLIGGRVDPKLNCLAEGSAWKIEW